MSRLTGVVLLLAISSGIVFGQSSLPLYDWDKERKPVDLAGGEQDYPEYILTSYRSVQYEWENSNLVAYQTEHKIIKVNNTNAIERHNRIYISMRNVTSITQLKARAITREGKVTNFDQRNLKEVKDEKTDNTYRIFAIEGIETGSEIEYFYRLKLSPRSQESYYFQQDTPIRNFTFLVTSPKSLKYDFRVYNDDQKVMADTLKGYNQYSYRKQGIPAIHDEAFSFKDTYKKRIEYKLAFNFTRSGGRINTWADAGRIFYSALTKTGKDEEKALARFIKTLGDDPGQAPLARIRNVENKVKSSIRINPNSPDPKLKELLDILKFRQANGEGMTKVMLMSYERLKIPVHLVMTCSREAAHFDGTFDTWNYLDEYLLYFPQTEGFLSPDEFELRYPLIPRELSGQKGLFIEPIMIANVKTGISFVRDIPALPYTADQDNMDIDVTFSPELDKTAVAFKRVFAGYDASSMLPYYETMSDEQRKKFVEEILKSTAPDVQLERWSVTSGTLNDVPSITIATTYQTGNFLEKAGSRILFKVGELIGPQSELYSEEERQLPIENTHNRGYDRVIRFTIPEGYTITNLDALNMNVTYKDQDKVPFSFVSTYTATGTQVTIQVAEYYKELYAPLNRYEDFRKVINAAADFNKVTLVLAAKPK